MKTVRYVLINIFCIFSLNVWAQASWSIEQCIDQALKSNPQLKRAALQFERLRINQQQARQSALPNVEGGISYGTNKGRTVDPTTNQFINQTFSSGSPSISAGTYLFNGFKTLHDIRQKTAGAMAGNLDFEAQKENLVLDVIEAYITTLTAHDLLKQVENQLALTEEQFKQAEILNEEGNIDPGDYHDLKGELNQSQNNRINAQKSLFHSRVKLAGLLNLNEKDLPELRPVSFLGSNNQVTSSELFELGKKRPFYALFDHKIKEAEEGIKVAQSGYFPSLYLGLGLDSRYSNSNPERFWEQNNNNLSQSLGISLRIPIFNGFYVRNSVNTAKINLRDVLWQKEFTENTLREATSNAVFDLKIAEETVKNLRELEKQYGESFRIAQTKYDLGVTNSVIYLNIKNKWENSKNELLIKQYEWILQKYINDYYNGDLNF